MTNIHPLTSAKAPSLVEVIDEEIQYRCWCLVNKRLALRLSQRRGGAERTDTHDV